MCTCVSSHDNKSYDINSTVNRTQKQRTIRKFSLEKKDEGKFNGFVLQFEVKNFKYFIDRLSSTSNLKVKVKLYTM
jgi:hypothetical protein